MTTQIVTLHLPEVVLQRAKHAADVLQRPMEEVLITMLTAMLPDVEEAPLHLQADLTRMTWLSDQELWNIAHSMMSDEQQQLLQQLTELQTQRPLTSEEQETLEMLRQEYGRITLYKARAYALLSLRGGRPLLSGN